MCVRIPTYPALDGHASYCSVVSSIACLALQFFFSHYLIKGTIFGGKKVSNIKFVFWFSLQLLSEIFLILRRLERDIIIHVRGMLISP